MDLHRLKLLRQHMCKVCVAVSLQYMLHHASPDQSKVLTPHTAGHAHLIQLLMHLTRPTCFPLGLPISHTLTQLLLTWPSALTPLSVRPQREYCRLLISAHSGMSFTCLRAENRTACWCSGQDYKRVNMTHIPTVCCQFLKASAQTLHGRPYMGGSLSISSKAEPRCREDACSCLAGNFMCVVMWGGRSFGLHTSKVRAKDRGHTYSLHLTHMGCLTWTVRAHVL
jgi:hypothetical protein